jgi:low affinity Fe/Cu permease
MVCPIQNTQNRDAKAVHLKLDEIIRAIRSLEELSDDELKKVEEQFQRLRKKAEHPRDTISPSAID